MAQVINQVCAAIVPALKSPHPQYELIRGLLFTLTQLETRPLELAEVAYDWCAMIWKNRQSYEDWTTPILLSLEVGFRHLHSSDSWTSFSLTRVQYHQELIDAILKSNNDEGITDLVYASYMVDRSRQLALDICANYIVDFRSGATGPFSSRLRKIFSACVELRGFNALEEVGKGRFVELLSRLHIGIEDVMAPPASTIWTTILLETIQSPDGALHLPVHSWELLAELVTSGIPTGAEYSPGVTASLLEAREWDKLECWMGVVWMAWPPEPGDLAKDFKHTMTSLFHQRPGATQKLAQWMERWSKNCRRDLPESFQEI